MNGDDLAMLGRLLDAGVPFAEAWPAVIVATWRGAEEPVQTIGIWPNEEPPQVGCVCGTSFTFKAGATRARCPGCGCRYELIPLHGR